MQLMLHIRTLDSQADSERIMSQSEIISTDSESESEIASCAVLHTESSVLRKRKLNRKLNQSSNITALSRASQPKIDRSYADGNVLFCSACEKAVDHSRQFVFNRHQESDAHQKTLSKNPDNVGKLSLPPFQLPMV